MSVSVKFSKMMLDYDSQLLSHFRVEFLEERRANHKDEDVIERTPSSNDTSDDGEDSATSNHGDKMEYNIPEDVAIGTEGDCVVAATHIPAGKVYGPYQGSVMEVDHESMKNGEIGDKVC